MEIPFSPAQRHVDEYRRFRALLMEMNHKMIKILPKQAYDDIGDAIGIRHQDTLIFDSEDMISVLMDCCIYDWFENGKNIVQRYAEAYPARPGTAENEVLQACLQAKYAILIAESAVPGAGMYCRDILNGGNLFLMDVSMSHTPVAGRAALATRILPVNQYWITGGASLPITSANPDLRHIETERDKLLRTAGGISLRLIRSCLAAGAINHIHYQTTPTRKKRRRRR